MKNTSTRIKCLIIIRGLDIGGFNGGGDRFGLELAKALDPARFQVTVCAFYRYYTPAELLWENDLRQRTIPLFYAADWNENRRLAGILSGMRQVARHFARDPLDICHSHFQLGAMLSLYLKLLHPRLALVSTFHLKDDWSHNPLLRLRKWIFTDWVYPFFLTAAVGVSQEIAFSLSQAPGARLFGKKARYIPNALSISSSPGDAQPTPDLGFTPAGRLLGVIGRLSPQKGITYLIQALPRVLAEYPAVELLVVGDGTERRALEEQVRQAGLAAHVHFLGLRQDIPALFSRLDLFVLPSLFEGLPTVILESMACGVPVVATDIPGTRELVEHGVNGWLVPPRNPALLAQAILNALNDPLACALVKKNGFTTSQSFTIQAIAVQYENLYAE